MERRGRHIRSNFAYTVLMLNSRLLLYLEEVCISLQSLIRTLWKFSVHRNSTHKYQIPERDADFRKLDKFELRVLLASLGRLCEGHYG